MRFSATRYLLAVAVALVPASLSLSAQTVKQLDSTMLAGFRWRAVGPANMSGRVTDVEGIPGPSKTFYFAAASGGIWKSTNNGTTFKPIFDTERVISMGDLAIAPSDTHVVYAGTGEEDSRNSISPGGGVYKTVDGGKTWKFMGLKETQAIGRIVVHPTDPKTVYVAAVGHIWGPNKGRGLYKSADGGETWQLIKFISDRAGFVDVALHPNDPNTVFAASWERVRGPYFLRSGGPGSALWKSTDAGKTWTEVAGGGFPATRKGRISIAISPSDPRIIYTMVEADSVKGAKDEKGKAQGLLNGLYRSSDGGATWTRVNSENTRPFYYSQVRVDPKNPDRVYWSSTPVKFSDDGGKTARNATVGIHVDHHAMWIDPNDPERFIVGNDGGVAITFDRGGSYNFPNTMPLGQFYEISYDMDVPYNVCGGLQDNGSWCGPSRRRRDPIVNANWYTVGGGDGFYTAQDPTDPNIIYSESQGGNIGRMDLRSGERISLVKPSWRPLYLQTEDSILVTRGDTAARETPEVRKRVAELRSRQRTDSAAFDMRFNWNTPFFLSPHSPTTFYAAGNRVLKSTNRGENLYPISHDLSSAERGKIDTSMTKTGGITIDATGAETYGTVTTLAESPVRPGILYAGTDDGNVWLTRNDGASWENISGRFPGVPSRSYVVRIEPSHFDTATVYVAFDNHRVNDFTPYLYVSNDFGRTFRSIANNLPKDGPDFLHVVREDPHNRDLLFVGTDVGVYVSLNRGSSWQKFMTGLPTVPVHDLKIHPRDAELIAGTHGRSIWIVDILPLEQMRDSVLTTVAHLFRPTTAFQYGEAPVLGESPGHQVFEGNPGRYGATITYRLASGRRTDRTKLLITDVRGDTVNTVDGPGGPGLHRVYWDFRGKAAKSEPLSPAARRDSIVNAGKMNQILDSLVAHEGLPKPAVERIKKMVQSGDIGGLFGGGGGQRTYTFQERPGESSPPRGQRRGQQARPDTGVARPDTAAVRQDTAGVKAAVAAAPPDTAAGVAAEAAAGTVGEPPIDPDIARQVFTALRRAGLTTGFGMGGGGRQSTPTVPSGDYLVTMTVEGRTMRQVLRVERADGGNGARIATGGAAKTP
ncbi:MAG: WD40/YVTN/BNR-like repeat-containing protein [Gemmatimonadaceae bacterium]